MARFWTAQGTSEALFLPSLFVDALDLLGDDVHVVVGRERLGNTVFSLDILMPEAWYLGWVVLPPSEEAGTEISSPLPKGLNAADFQQRLLRRKTWLVQVFAQQSHELNFLQRTFIFFPKGRPSTWAVACSPSPCKTYENPRDLLTALLVDRIRPRHKVPLVEPASSTAVAITQRLGNHTIGTLAYPAALLLESARKRAFYVLDPAVEPPWGPKKPSAIPIAWWAVLFVPPIAAVLLGAGLALWKPEIPDTLVALWLGLVLGPLLGGFLLYLQVQGLSDFQRRALLLVVAATLFVGLVWMAEPETGRYTFYGLLLGGLVTWAASWYSKWRAFIAGWAWGTLLWACIALAWLLLFE